MSLRTLTPGERVEACRMWDQGASLYSIAVRFDCSIYDLSPWIYMCPRRSAKANSSAGGDSDG